MIELFERYKQMILATDLPFPDPHKCGKEHLVHLCNMAISGTNAGTMPYGKACRWLGFIQGILCACGIAKVETEQEFTRELLTRLDREKSNG